MHHMLQIQLQGCGLPDSKGHNGSTNADWRPAEYSGRCGFSVPAGFTQCKYYFSRTFNKGSL